MAIAAAAAAAGLSAVCAPSAVASPSPLEVVSVGPLPVQAPGPVTVRLRLRGADEAAEMHLSFAPTAVPVPRVGGSTVRVREVHTEGPGGRIELTHGPAPTAAPPSRAVPDNVCLRGGYTESHWPGLYTSAVVVVDAGAPVDVVATVEVPPGLHGVPASLVINTTQLVPRDRDPLTPGRAPADPIVLDLPRAGPVADRITLSLGGRAGKRVRLRGRVVPARGGVSVEVAGRRTPNSTASEVLGNERLATGPIGRSLRRFGEATTDEAGRWSAWLTLPPRVAVVARTAPESGVTLGGASCGLWFSSPTLDQRAADARRKAKRRR